MTESMQIALTAINKWMYFGWNYKTIPHEWKSGNGELKTGNFPEFLVKAKWTCNFDHMAGKWAAAIRTDDCHSYLSRFYAELDTDNRRALLEWVMEHYQDERKLFY